MPRRPWPIVILALFLVLSPFFGWIGAALFYQTPIIDVVRDHWEFSTVWQLLEAYLLPVTVGIALYSTRKGTYYFTLCACAFLIYRNITAFLTSPGEFSLWLPIWANLAVAILATYLLNPRVRRIYFDPALRWWKTPPRYAIRGPARVYGDDGAVFDMQLRDLSDTGAGLESSDDRWKNGDEVILEFEYAGVRYRFPGFFPYVLKLSEDRFRVGLKWSATAQNSERSRIRRLVRELKRSGALPVQQLPHWWTDLKAWLRLPIRDHFFRE